MVNRSTFPPAHRHLAWLSAGCLVFVPAVSWASSGASSATTWLAIGGILLAAIYGGDLATRLKQPPVLGEVLAGVLLGNLSLLGFDVLPELTELPELAFLAELGVLLLLFEVGLESTLAEMRRAASQSGAVAIIGVAAPLLLGLVAIELAMPEATLAHHFFVAAAMAATSVSITVRVLKDLGASHRPETSVLLGAAVTDDILGLILLSLVSAFAVTGAVPDATTLGTILGSAVGFLAGSLLLGLYVTPRLFRVIAKLRVAAVLPIAALGFCLLLSGLSVAFGLAAIIGAFAAGLLLDEAHILPFAARSTRSIEEFVHPITAFFAPIFFVYTGLSVDLSTFSFSVIVVAILLTIAAILGKLVSGLGAGGSLDRLTVGLGMIPRGEVGLIFANVGATTLVAGTPVVDAPTYGAIVAMVLLTTVAAPPLLAARLGKLQQRGPRTSRRDGD